MESYLHGSQQRCQAVLCQLVGSCSSFLLRCIFKTLWPPETLTTFWHLGRSPSCDESVSPRLKSETQLSIFPCGWNTDVWPSLHQWGSLTKDYNSETNGIKKKVCGAPSLVRVAAEMAILQTQQDRGPVIPLAVQSVGSLDSGGSSVILTGADLWYNCGIVPGGGASKPGFLILPSTPENILIFVGGKRLFYKLVKISSMCKSCWFTH